MIIMIVFDGRDAFYIVCVTKVMLFKCIKNKNLVQKTWR